MRGYPLGSCDLAPRVRGERGGETMQLTYLGGNCGGGGTCPTVYQSDRGTLVIQGYAAPDREGSVLVPAILLGPVRPGAFVRSLRADTMEVRGRAVDPANVEGLLGIAENEALVEIPRQALTDIPHYQLNADWLAAWAAGSLAAVLGSRGIEGVAA